MKGRLVIIVLLTVMFTFYGASGARDLQSLEKNIPADSDVKKVRLESDIGVAHLRISSHDNGDLISSHTRYDADRVEVKVEYDKKNSSADLFLFSEKVSRRLELDTDDCEWDISLSRDYIWNMNLDIGFTDSDLDFSGLALENFELDIGASECQIVFGRPNPEKMRRLNIDAGAGELKVLGLGYANFEDMKFDGGAGEFVLNFDGLGEGFHTARIDIGVGEARIEIPKDYPVRIECEENWLNSLKIRGSDLEEVDDGVYETEGFDDFDYGLEIDLDLGIGKVIIGWADGSGSILTARSMARPGIEWGRIRHGDILYGRGLPALPALPALPELASLPAIPALPALPELPELVEVYELREFQELPELPEVPEIPPLPRSRKVLE